MSGRLSQDWQLKVNLGNLLIPRNHRSDHTRPDMVLMSEISRQVILQELTVPWEDQMEQAYKGKKAKKKDLDRECQTQGWQV